MFLKLVLMMWAVIFSMTAEESPVNLKLELALDQPQCLQGESVLFRITLTNAGNAPAAGLADFNPLNYAVKLRARAGRAQRYQGYELGASLRDERAPNTLHWHATSMTLKPNEKKEIQGDVLWWLGELPAGEYLLSCTYQPIPGDSTARVQSPEVKLRVNAAKPTFVSVPRLPQMPVRAPLTAVWRHGQGREERYFLQQQSRLKPPNPYHCFEIKNVPAEAQMRVATVSLASPNVGHIVWPGKRELLVLQAAMDKPTDAQPWKIPAPVPQPVVLESPRTTSEGDLLALFTDEQNKELYLLVVHDQKSEITALELGDAGPIGHYCVHWTLIDTLEFAWSTKGKRELYYSTIDPQDPERSFAPRHVGTEGAPLLRIDLLTDSTLHGEALDGIVIDQPGAEDEPLPEEEGDAEDLAIEPRLQMFTLSAETRPPRLVLRRRQLPGGAEAIVTRISLPSDVSGDVIVEQSVMTGREEPVYLLRDAKSNFLFASSQERAGQPLNRVVGEEVRPERCPALLAASQDEQDPWVHVRYASEQASGFRFVKLEPAKVEDKYRMFREDAGTP